MLDGFKCYRKRENQDKARNAGNPEAWFYF